MYSLAYKGCCFPKFKIPCLIIPVTNEIFHDDKQLQDPRNRALRVLMICLCKLGFPDKETRHIQKKTF